MSTLSDSQVRICANACVARYERGEGELTAIVNSYPLKQAIRKRVLAEIYAKRPNLQPEQQTLAAQRRGKWYSTIFRKKTVSG